MGESYLIAGIFLGVLLLIVIGLVMLWCCVNREMCWFQKIKARDDSIDIWDPLMDKLKEGDEQSSHIPFDTVTVTEQDNGSNFHYDLSRNKIPNDSSNNSSSGSTRKSQSSTITAATTPSMILKSKSSGDIKLSLTLTIGKHLTVNIEQITGLNQFADHDSILVSATCLSGKKTTKQTKLHQVYSDGTSQFDETFEFFKVNGDLLRRAQMRFRVYGRMSTTVIICLGEVFVLLDQEDLIDGKVTLHKTIGKMMMRKMKYHKE